jgi:sec-independent protein translocase protein TatA
VPSIGFGEILIIAVLALIIFGPKRLPEMGKNLARSLREVRRATSDIRSELTAETDDLPRTTVEERSRRLRERKARSDPPAEETPPPD